MCVCVANGVCHSGLLVLLALAFLTPMFYYIPDTALAAVIIMAVTDMISFTMISHLWTINSMCVFACCTERLAHRGLQSGLRGLREKRTCLANYYCPLQLRQYCFQHRH